MPKSSLLLVPALLAASLAVAQTPQQNDPDFAAKVKEWTTKPEFSSPLVDHLPSLDDSALAQGRAGLPHRRAEAAHLLRGRPRATTTRWPPHRRASRSSSIGKTEEGRDSVIVFIGSEDSIANLDTIQEEPRAPGRSARPHRRRRPKRSSPHTKPIYTLSGGLHSAELGPPEMLMELAYRLATEDSAAHPARSARTSSSPSCPSPTPTAATATSTGTTVP